MGKIYIVAGTHEIFQNYVREKRREEILGKKKYEEYVYIRNTDQLRGLSSIQGFYIYGWDQRPDIVEIKIEIAHIKYKERVLKKFTT